MGYLKKHWRLLLGIIASVVAVFFIFFQKSTIKKSIIALKDAEWQYVLLAILVFSITVFAAAAIIYSLRLVNKTRFKDILIVQTATLFLGKITPASVGALAAMGRLLFTQGHTLTQSGTVVAAGGIATFIGNVLITIMALIFSINSIDLANMKVPTFIIYIFMGFVVVCLVLLTLKQVRKKLKKVIKDVVETLKYYKTNKASVIYAIFFGAVVTLCFALTMMLAAKSLGVSISLFAAIITISFGSLGVAVTPLPGGMVGAEAALAATLVQFGVAADVALAIAFVYRFVIFWLPLLPGFIASQLALKKQLL